MYAHNPEWNDVISKSKRKFKTNSVRFYISFPHLTSNPVLTIVNFPGYYPTTIRQSNGVK